MDEGNIQSFAELLRNYHPSDGEISLCVQPLMFGCYGVFADAVLIAIHTDQAGADAHYQRLRVQQAEE